MLISRPYRINDYIDNYFDNYFTPFIKYNREIDRLFDSLFEPITVPSYPQYRKRNRESFYVEQNDNEVNIVGILPNKYNKDLIKIEIENKKNGDRILHISIKYKKNRRDFRGRIIKTYQSELKQSFSLDGKEFDFEKVSAKVEDGKLYVNLPRKENKEEIIPIHYVNEEEEKEEEEAEIPIKHKTNENVEKEKEEEVEIPIQYSTMENNVKKEDGDDKMVVETENEDQEEKNENKSFKVEIKDEEILDSQEEEEETAIVSDVVE